MGKRATVTQVVHSARNRDGFIEDAFWGSTGGPVLVLCPPARIPPCSALPSDRCVVCAPLASAQGHRAPACSY